MSQLIIETDTIKKAVLYFLALVGVIAIIGVAAVGIADRFCQHTEEPAVVPVTETVATPEPTAVPTAQSTAAYQSLIQFTVISTTVADGHYSAYTTLGQTLYLPDYYSWDSLWPRSTYVATITGIEANGALDIGTINLVQTPYDFPVYFHDPNTNTYWRWDGYTSEKISYSQVRGERIIEGRPPSVSCYSTTCSANA